MVYSGSCNKCELKETKKSVCAHAYNEGYVKILKLKPLAVSYGTFQNVLSKMSKVF